MNLAPNGRSRFGLVWLLATVFVLAAQIPATAQTKGQTGSSHQPASQPTSWYASQHGAAQPGGTPSGDQRRFGHDYGKDVRPAPTAADANKDQPKRYEFGLPLRRLGSSTSDESAETWTGDSKGSTKVGGVDISYDGKTTAHFGRLEKLRYTDLRGTAGGNLAEKLTKAGLDLQTTYGASYSVGSIENRGKLTVAGHDMETWSRADALRGEGYALGNVGFWMEKDKTGQWRPFVGAGGELGASVTAFKAAAEVKALDSKYFDLGARGDLELLKAEAKLYGKAGFDVKRGQVVVQGGVDTHAYLAKVGAELRPDIEVEGVRLGLRPKVEAYAGYGKKLKFDFALGSGKLDLGFEMGTSFEFLGIPGGVNFGIGVSVDISGFLKKHGKTLAAAFKKMEQGAQAVADALAGAGQSILGGFAAFGNGLANFGNGVADFATGAGGAIGNGLDKAGDFLGGLFGGGKGGGGDKKPSTPSIPIFGKPGAGHGGGGGGGGAWGGSPSAMTASR